MKTLTERVLTWALGDNTGISSEAIARHMTGNQHGDLGPYYPSGGADLGRCIGLLDVIPEWRERMPEMAEYSAAWSELVEAWDELEKMWRNNDPTLYWHIKEILFRAQIDDPPLVKYRRKRKSQ